MGADVGFAVAFDVGLGVGFGVGLGVGRGVAAGLHPATPLVDADPPAGFGTWYLASGFVPVGGNMTAASARIFLRFGFWIEPRESNPDDTSGDLITKR